jgi:hypothetical protein
MNIQLHPSARADLHRQIEYLQAMDAGEESMRQFHAVVREALEKIDMNPQTWSFATGSRRVRKVQILSFRM